MIIYNNISYAIHNAIQYIDALWYIQAVESLQQNREKIQFIYRSSRQKWEQNRDLNPFLLS